MVSGISSKLASYWKNTETIRLGGCFRVKWVTTANLMFNKISNMTNPYCDNELIRKSRDSTEIDPKAGRELCHLFEIPFREPSVPCPLPS